MGFAADGYPLVGSLNEEPRVYYNVGFTAHGLGFTFATGELTARLILEGKDPGIFSGRRFEK
jgi:glycine/D-amino acid oxidase-like deaminating enzyme